VTVIFIIPYILIYGTPLPEYLSRSFSYGIFFVGMPIWMLWWSLDPNVERIPQYARLSRSGYEKPKKVVELLLKILFCILAASLVWYATIPFTQDSIGLIRSSKISVVQGMVEDRSSYIGTSYISQGIMLIDNDGRMQNYRLMYSFPRVEPGVCIRFMALPKSKLVLKMLTNNTKSSCRYKISGMD
jgi:hypothetical protein